MKYQFKTKNPEPMFVEFIEGNYPLELHVETVGGKHLCITAVEYDGDTLFFFKSYSHKEERTPLRTFTREDIIMKILEIIEYSITYGEYEKILECLKLNGE